MSGNSFKKAAEDILRWEEKISEECIAKGGRPEDYFAHEKLERTVELCLTFMRELAKMSARELAEEHDIVLRLRDMTLNTNGKLAERTHLHAGLVNGITLIENTLFNEILNSSELMLTLARFGVAFEPLVRGQLVTNFTYLCYELNLHNGKLPRFIRRQLFFFKRLPTLLVQLISLLHSKSRLTHFLENEGAASKQIESFRARLRSIEAKEDIILWHTSGNDPRFAVKDGRTLSAVRELMIQEGHALLLKNARLNSSAVAKLLVQKFEKIPGAYDSADALRRQLDRTKA